MTRKNKPQGIQTSSIAQLSTEQIRHLDASVLENISWSDFTGFNKSQLSALGELIEQAHENTKPFCFTIPPFILGPLPQKNLDRNHFSRHFRWQEIHYSSSIGQEIPGGAPARIILLHIVTTIAQTREPYVDMKHSVCELMRNFGIKPSYGAKGTVAKYEEALMSLMHTIVEVRLTQSDGDEMKIEEMRFPIFSRDAMTINEKGLATGIAKIDDQFAQVVLQSSVVLDRNTVISLCRSRSPAALDIYIWSTYTNYYLSKHHRPNIRLTWDEAYEMFSNKDIEKKAFKRDFQQKVSLVEKHYPNLRLVTAQDGITLWKTKTHIKPAMPKRQPKIARTLDFSLAE